MTKHHTPPAPGTFVDVGGVRTHVVIEGRGMPAVLIEPGLGDNVLSWDSVAAGLASQTTVVRRDRPGLGWTPYVKTDRSAVAAAESFHQLLDTIAIPGPYVLVGHSLGALHVRAFAAAHPEQVAGVVLVDPTHEHFFDHFPAFRRTHKAQRGLLRALVAGQAVGGRVVLQTLYSKAARASLADPSNPEALRLLATWKQLGGPDSDLYRATYEEEAALEATFAQIEQLRQSTTFPSVPLEVISQDGATGNAKTRKLLERIRTESHTDLLTLSAKSTHTIATDSGHMVHIERPSVVVDAVRRVLAAAR